MGRGFREESFRRVVSEFKDRGTRVSVDTILGLPGETFEDFVETYKTAVMMEPNGIVVNSLFLNPGTKLSEHSHEYGIEFQRSDAHNVPVITGSVTFPQANIARARNYVKRSMEKFSNIEITLR
jgi:coproporphyrinogen III oxidase-like Fe-S oxidoreductase